MDAGISREEHEEFRRRIEEADRRQDKRLEILEGTVGQIHALTASVERLAVSMERMAKEQEKQGERLETLEARDGEMWRKVVSHVASVLTGAVVAWMLSHAGL